MELSKLTIDYISALNLPNSIKSNLLITDLEKIIYADTQYVDVHYLFQPLSKDILSLISNWKTLPITEDLFLTENNPSRRIIGVTNETYSAQMIFPIYLSNKLERTRYLFQSLW